MELVEDDEIEKPDGTLFWPEHLQKRLSTVEKDMIHLSPPSPNYLTIDKHLGGKYELGAILTPNSANFDTCYPIFLKMFTP